MKMLKVMPLAAAALLLLGACTGGSKKSQGGYSDVNAKINIWATAAEEAVIKAVVDEYNAKQTEETSKFNYEFRAVSEGDCGSTLGKDPTVAGAPALALIADDQIYDLQSKNIILEVKGNYKETVTTKNTPVAVSGASYGDKVYGFPVTSDNGYFLWYNKSVLSEEDVKSLEGIMAKVESVGKKFGMALDDGWYAASPFFSPDVCGTNSLSFHENDQGKVVYDINWDNDAGAAAAEALSAFLAPKKTSGSYITVDNAKIVAGFGDGSLAAAVSGTWMESDLIEAAGAENLAAVKLPTFNVSGAAKQLGSFTGSKVYVVNKTRPIEEQKAAAALADLLTNKESQLVRFDKRKSLPCNIEAAADETYKSKVSIGGAALMAQNQFAAVQAKSAEGRYWNTGAAIGTAIINGDIGSAANWQAYLKSQCDVLRAPAA